MRRYVPLLLAIVLGGCSIGGGDSTTTGSASLATSGPAPTSTQRQGARKPGFPAVATRNTIRVGGGDPVADLAGVAAAVFPATTPSERPHAVVLVDKNDWQGAVAGSVLNAQPFGAPLLASDGGKLPAATPPLLNSPAP